MSRLITNCWGEARTRRLALKEQVIAPGVAGAAYHHHQHVLAMDGLFYATFSEGRLNEDDVGQRVMLAVSRDAGQSWDKPRAIVIPPMGEHAPCVATATGLHAHAGRLVVYYGQYEYTADGLDGGQRRPDDAAHRHTATWAVISEDGGATWGEPIHLLDNFVANLGPQQAGNGRLIMPGSVVYAWTDDPAGTEGWTWAGLPGLPGDHVDDSAGFQRCLRENKRAHGYCEGSMFRTDDGILHMMLRTNERFLAVTESHDNGASWSLPEPTTFTDNSSRHQFGRLPGGRFFALSTPKPEDQWQRTPLVIALSEDGRVFDRHVVIGDATNPAPKMAGLHKHGRYGYPYLATDGETVVVLYSIAKESVAALAFPLAELG